MISAEYLDQLKRLHDSRIWGASGYSHASEVAKYRREIGAQTILDFGCGRATLKKTLLEMDPSIDAESVIEYDPAIEGKDRIPQPADLLVANDVLEHIEPIHLNDTMKFLRSLALMGAYFTIAISMSKVLLPNGQNAHLIIKPKEWWLIALRHAGFKIKRAEMRKGLWVWAK